MRVLPHVSSISASIRVGVRWHPIIEMTGGGQTVGLLIVFVPLALWALLCLREALGWARDGRKTTHQSYIRNRMR